MEREHISDRVSIIIPTYNQADFLGDAINSALNQTYKNIEVIVVDDGSTDNTKEVCLDFNNLKYVYQKNQGQGSARNTGLGRSVGEYVIFLDSDDRLMDTAVEIGLNDLKKHSESAFVFGYVRIIDVYGNTHVEQIKQKIIKDNFYERLLKGNYIWTMGAVFFKKNILEQINGFNNYYRGGQDWELYLRITRFNSIHCHGNKVLEYRLHNENITKNSLLMLKYSHNILRSQRSYIKGNTKLENAYKTGVYKLNKYYGDPLVENTRMLIRNKNYINAITNMITLVRYYPKGFIQNFICSIN